MLTEEKKPLRLEHWNEKEIEALNKVSSYAFRLYFGRNAGDS